MWKELLENYWSRHVIYRVTPSHGEVEATIRRVAVVRGRLRAISEVGRLDDELGPIHRDWHAFAAGN